VFLNFDFFATVWGPTQIAFFFEGGEPVRSFIAVWVTSDLKYNFFVIIFIEKKLLFDIHRITNQHNYYKQKINHKCYWLREVVFLFEVKYLLNTLSAFSLANLTFSSNVLALVAEET